MSELTPVAVEQGNMTILPKLQRLILDNTGSESSITIEWCKIIIETGDEIPQSNMELTSSVMNHILPDGFLRYNPLTGEAITGAPTITQQEMMMFVYSVFKNMITTDLTIGIDIDVPEEELMVDD